MMEKFVIDSKAIKKKLFAGINDDVDNQILEDYSTRLDNNEQNNNPNIEKRNTRVAKSNNFELANKNINDNDLKKQNFLEQIKNAHNKTLRYLEKEYNIEIWKKSLENTYYYRINPFSKKIKITSNDEFLKLSDKQIKVYENIKDVYFEDNILILVKSLISDIKDEVFYPYEDREFFKINQIEYRNTFQYSSFLYKKVSRLRRNIEEVCIVKEYLYNMMSQDEEKTNYIIAWLSHFFQTLNKSSTALVLIGDKEATDIFINEIIKPIFAYKKEYFCSLNNDTIKKFDESILKEKIFYHLDELAKNSINEKKVSKMLLNILKRNKLTAKESIELEEDYIYGQLIVTASKDTPYPILKDCYSRCAVFEVNSLDSILVNMNFERFQLEEAINLNLYYFSKILAQVDNSWYEDKYGTLKVFETEEKHALQNMKNGVLRTVSLENQIDKFVLNIENKNINYFTKIGNNLLEELKKNFKENMIAQPLLAIYFNKINGKEIFLDNGYFLEILKEKSEMFKITPTDKSKSNGKKRYEILSNNRSERPESIQEIYLNPS